MYKNLFFRLLAAFSLIQTISWVVVVFIKGGLTYPFWHDVNDTFMDYYNTRYWADSISKYSVWHSIYPAFSFAITKLICTVELCYGRTPFEMRDFTFATVASSQWYVISPTAKLMLMYFLSNSMLFLYIISKQKLPIFSMALILFNNPLGYIALERGNLVIVAYFFLVLSIISYQRLSCFFKAAAVLVKPYLFPIIFGLEKKGFVSCFLIFVTSLVTIEYISTNFIGGYSLLTLASNYLLFGAGPSSLYLLVKSTTSILLLPAVISAFANNFYNIQIFIKYLTYFFLISSFICYLIGYCRSYKYLEQNQRIFFILLGIAVVVPNLGVYSLILTLPYVITLVIQKPTNLHVVYYFFLATVFFFPPYEGPIHHVEFIKNFFTGFEVGVDVQYPIVSCIRIFMLYLTFVVGAFKLNRPLSF